MFSSIKNPELINVLPLQPGVCLNIATHALLTASKFFLVQFPGLFFFFFFFFLSLFFFFVCVFLGGGEGGRSFFLCFLRLFSNPVATF